jgi:hypothetical protein
MNTKQEFETVGQIYVTNNYDLFTTIKGNRLINQRNYSKLLKSMKEEQLCVPILVNEDYGVIDGQHRLQVCKELGLPVYFIVKENYGLEQVKRCNLVGSVWLKTDFLNMFVEQEIHSYLTFKSLIEHHNVALTCLLKIVALVQQKNLSVVSYQFENGEFTLTDEDIIGVEKFFICLEDFNFFTDYKSKSFLSAFIKLYTQTSYKHDTMRSKLKLRSFILKKSTNEEGYLSTLCNDIYSYGMSSNNAIRYINRRFIIS